MAKQLTKKEYRAIVDRAKNGKSMKAIIEETGQHQGTVGPVLIHAGIRKSREDIAKYETERVDRWLQNAADWAKEQRKSTPKEPTQA